MVTSEEWDFYPCRVDDAPASIFLNLACGQERPEGLDTMYYIGLQILEPGEHGMGIEPDVKALHDLEDALVSAAAAAGFTFVGRLRNKGDWQLTFYATGGDREPELEELVLAALADTDRGYRTGSEADDSWSYFDDFLMPDDERYQWIMNRRVLEQLRQAGDAHDVLRPVDHFIEFPDPASRDAFMAAARERGFSAEAGELDEADPHHTAELQRDDPVTLDHIHDVVMELAELADEHGGEYEGWGAPIASPSN